MVLKSFGKQSISRVAAATLWTVASLAGLVPTASGAVDLPVCKTGPGGARPADVYVPIDSWVYPELDRLHGLGYLNTSFLGIRPWTRRSIQRMIDETSQEESIQSNSQAIEILAALQREFGAEEDGPSELSYGCEGLYTRFQGISGLTLRDSFHLGQTLVNDYGRPYQPGFNTVDGASRKRGVWPLQLVLRAASTSMRRELRGIRRRWWQRCPVSTKFRSRPTRCRRRFPRGRSRRPMHSALWRPTCPTGY